MDQLSQPSKSNKFINIPAKLEQETKYEIQFHANKKRFFHAK